MKCQDLFSGENKKNVSKCSRLKILPGVLRVKCINTIYVCDVFVYDNILSTVIMYRRH